MRLENKVALITGATGGCTDIVVDGGWVTAAPYLGNDRRHHMLQLLRTKEAAKEKKEAVEEFLKRHL